jgi:hypothetical protein
MRRSAAQTRIACSKGSLERASLHTTETTPLETDTVGTALRESRTSSSRTMGGSRSRAASSVPSISKRPSKASSPTTMSRRPRNRRRSPAKGGSGASSSGGSARATLVTTSQRTAGTSPTRCASRAHRWVEGARPKERGRAIVVRGAHLRVEGDERAAELAPHGARGRALRDRSAGALQPVRAEHVRRDGVALAHARRHGVRRLERGDQSLARGRARSVLRRATGRLPDAARAAKLAGDLRREGLLDGAVEPIFERRDARLELPEALRKVRPAPVRRHAAASPARANCNA